MIQTMNMSNFIGNFLNSYFNNKSTNKENKPKRKYTKRTFKEKDCDVYYDPTWLFAMNYPGEYVDFEEI